MCGRYALGVRLATVRRRLQDQGMQVDEAPDDDQVRETYNFAPGYYGAVYRAEPSDHRHDDQQAEADSADHQTDEPNTKYKLQSMKWGLVPFWTKRQPDYGSLMRTINCRDDSLVEDRGMWTSMKRRKRCVVVCQGFYEWLKKGPGGKEKVPHFVKRRDGELMCFAGLWDCVSYDGSDEQLYTYTIITTSSNSDLKFLHDRMPVILDPGSEAMKTWLDPSRTTWSKELQSALNPYEGELECYAVPKEVGKVGNNSPDFIVPVASKDNKNNIANFFANAKKKPEVKTESKSSKEGGLEQKVVKEEDERRTTQDSEWTEDNAPVPVPGVKREHPPNDSNEVEDDPKKQKLTTPSPVQKSKHTPTPASSRKQTPSATHNTTPSKGSQKKATDGSKPITAFFQK